ncbi:hypothetical protein RAD16_09810 [Bradyrhizobium sp. 18BD]
MVDKWACRSLSVGQRRSTELCATIVGKNSPRTKIAHNNLAERTVVAIHLDESGAPA